MRSRLCAGETGGLPYAATNTPRGKCGKLLEKLQEVRQYFASTEIPQFTSDEPLGPRFALVLGQRIACRVSSTRWQRATQAVPRLPSPPRQEAWVAVNACRDRRVRSVCSGCMRRRSSIGIEPFSSSDALCDRLLGGPHRVRLEFAESARSSPPTSTVWPGMNVDLMLNVSCCLQLPGTGMDCRLGKRGKRSEIRVREISKSDDGSLKKSFLACTKDNLGAAVSKQEKSIIEMHDRYAGLNRRAPSKIEEHCGDFGQSDVQPTQN